MASLIALNACATHPPVDPPTPSEPEPVVLGADNGLELRIWTIAVDQFSDKDPISTALYPFLTEKNPWDTNATERWRTAGLRAVIVPLSQIESLRSKLPLTGQIDRRWLGQQPNWGTLFRGTPLPSTTILSGDQHAIVFRGGFLRLLIRSWTTPTPLGPRIAIGVALQHVDNNASTDLFGKALQGHHADPLDAGVVHRGLTVDGMFEQGAVIVIVAAAPDEQWGSDPDNARQSSHARTLPGPRVPSRKTIGEQLLQTDRTRTKPETKTVILLIPRAPLQHTIL